MNGEKGDTPAIRLDWIDRSVGVYLAFPVFLFCLWFIPPIAIALVVLTGYATYRALSGGITRAPPISPALAAALLALALAWSCIAGVGHFFYSNLDWVVRDAVLHDLSSARWPATYTDQDAPLVILRAPLGYYLPAALAGHFAGFDAANVALYLWTAVGWWLFLASACRLFNTFAQRLACVFLIMLFGGMDLLGYVWGQGQLPPPGAHLEWWMPFVQYSSNTTLLFWVPNHALPAWLGISLILKHWRRPELARLTPLMATAIPLWSPLAAIGLFPFFLFALAWRRDIRTLFSSRSSLPLAPIAIAIAIYLGIDSSAVSHAWATNYSPSIAAFAYRYTLFCLLEFGVLAMVLARLGPLGPPDRIALAVLCLLPFVVYGPGNDLAMRASIPSLAVLALATARVLPRARTTPWGGILVVVLGVGAVGALQEPLRSLTHARWAANRWTIPQSMALLSPESTNHYPPHYFVSADSHWLLRLMTKQEPIQGPGLAGSH